MQCKNIAYKQPLKYLLKQLFSEFFENSKNDTCGGVDF